MVKLAIYRPFLAELEQSAQVTGAKCELEASKHESVPVLAYHTHKAANAQINDCSEVAASSTPGVLAFKHNFMHNQIIIKRAKAIARNRECPSCRSVRVTLWDDTQGEIASAQHALNIIFHCDRCHTSWRD